MMGAQYIGAWDVPKDSTATISKVEVAELPGNGRMKANKKPVLSFRNTEKRLVVNATIGNTIASLYGTDVEQWIGKQITLYATTCRAADGSGQVDCVRVRPKIPTARGGPIVSHPVDEDMRSRQISAMENQDVGASTETPRMREPGDDDE